MRLHLLQGIVLFHQNKHSEARKILEETQHELALLKVDDTSLCELVEFGTQDIFLIIIIYLSVTFILC